MPSSSATAAAGNSGRDIVICSDLEALSQSAAAFLTRSAQEAVNERGRFAVALSGGSTPRRTYEHWAGLPEVPWGRVHLFWGDERVLPQDHPESNYRLVEEALLSKVPLPRENVHRMPVERGDPQAVASLYEEALRAFWVPAAEGWPCFDVTLNGIGADGHTASLFPGSAVLKEKTRWVAAPYVEKLSAYRLTLTLPVFNHARQVVFLAAGEQKSVVVKEVLADQSELPLPARLIRPLSGRLRFFLDRAAGRLIDAETIS